MRHLRFRPALALGLLAALAAPRRTGAEEPAAIIARLQEKANSHENVQFTMHQTLHAPGQALEATADVAYAGRQVAIDMQMTMETPKPMTMQSRTVMADDVMWTHLPMMNMVNKVDMARIRAEAPEAMPQLDQRPGNLLATFEGIEPAYHGTEDVDGALTHHFTVTAAQQAEMQDQTGAAELPTNGDIDLWIADTDGLPRRMIARGPDGTPVVTIRFTDVVLNATLPDDTFTFTPPPGAQVVDATEAMLAAIKSGRKVGGTAPGLAPVPAR